MTAIAVCSGCIHRCLTFSSGRYLCAIPAYLPALAMYPAALSTFSARPTLRENAPGTPSSTLPAATVALLTSRVPSTLPRPSSSFVPVSPPSSSSFDPLASIFVACARSDSAVLAAAATCLRFSAASFMNTEISPTPPSPSPAPSPSIASVPLASFPPTLFLAAATNLFASNLPRSTSAWSAVSALPLAMKSPNTVSDARLEKSMAYVSNSRTTSGSTIRMASCAAPWPPQLWHWLVPVSK